MLTLDSFPDFGVLMVSLLNVFESRGALHGFFKIRETFFNDEIKEGLQLGIA